MTLERLRSRPALAAAAVVLAAAAALVAVFVVGRSSAPSAIRPIRAGAVLDPRTPLFGDDVVARVEFAGDARRVAAGSVRVSAHFDAFRAVSKPVLRRQRAGNSEYVVWTAKLRCLGRACLPKRSQRRMTLPDARVTYVPRGVADTSRRSLSVAWPPLIVYSRVDPVEVDAADPRDEPPWRADISSVRTASYDVPPGPVALGLYGAGIGLLLGAVALVAPFLRRRPEPFAEADGELEAEPVPVTALDHALVLLERDLRSDGGVGARRRALELVASELERSGERELARSARRLAWSREAPAVEDALALARRARKAERKAVP